MFNQLLPLLTWCFNLNFYIIIYLFYLILISFNITLLCTLWKSDRVVIALMIEMLQVHTPNISITLHNILYKEIRRQESC